jgi:hypothetical protein
LAVVIAGAFFVQYAQYELFIFLAGGFLGALLLLTLFNWALIFLSAVVGAHLIQAAVVLPATGNAVLFVVLVVIGVLVQAGALRRSREVNTA